ncbi:response regulator transcription factor [Rhabdaerophilum sp. SD176]|uniref:response regulator transcription factor n=1 Tax=Rhabdaerophilum sp. SD176 TaxID=2983548 RepID=UPI0024DF7452|nr:response regulator transcription factor [Rhabdaerophilum sp. SD176]
MNEKTRVVLADRHPFIREGLRLALERSERISVVAEAEDGYAAALAAKSQKPDVVILDSAITKLDCVETINRILLNGYRPGIVVIIDSIDPVELHYLIRAGANGLLVKTASPCEYVNAVLSVSSGGSYFSSPITGHLFVQQERLSRGTNAFALTDREVEVLRLICQGFSNKDIARRCDLSVRTVETHRFNIRKKTNAPRVRDLVQIAQQLGLMERAQLTETPSTPLMSERRRALG